MPVSESTVQTYLRDRLQDLSVFKNGTVVINQWDALGRAAARANWVVIGNADDFEVDMSVAVVSPTKYVVQLFVGVPFVDWTRTSNQFRDVRQAIIDNFATEPVLGSDDAFVTMVANAGVISEMYNPYLTDEQLREALPDFVTQQLAVTVKV